MFNTTFSFWRRLVGRGDSRPATQTDERRLWVRYPADLTSTVQPASAPGTIRVSSRVRDISLGGANLLVDTYFEAGQLISVELPLRDGKDTLLVLACIVRVMEEKPGQFALGCVFSRELANEDLEGLGGQRVRHEPSDKRIWKRFPTNLAANFQKVGDLNNEVFSAQVLNVSANGVGLLVRDKIDTGTLLTVDFLSEDEVRRTILACVVHVLRRDQEEWALGCNFIRELSEEDLHDLI